MAAGCATPAPQVELSAYVQSFDTTYAVSNDILDVVGEFERVTQRAIATAEPGGDEEPDEFLTSDEAQAVAVGPQAVQSCENRGKLGPEAFCFELRHAFATIGDPPLTASFRRVLSVIHRYNILLVAYAEGRSGDILAAELGALQAEVNTGLALGGVALPEVGQLFAALKPIASFAGATGDRERFRAFLLENHVAVDNALEALMEGTEVLYSNIAQGALNLDATAGDAEAAILDRQLELSRRALANLTYLFEDTRAMLSELVVAVENPALLESRLRNIGVMSLQSRIDAEAVRRDLTSLGVDAQ